MVEAFDGAALVGIVDAAGDGHEVHSAGLPDEVVSRFVELGRRLAEGRTVTEAHPGAGGMAFEIADRVLGVVIAQPWPADDDPVADRLADACRLVLLAIGRVKHEHRDRRQTGQLARLQATAKRIAASLDLGEVLSCIVEDAASLFGAGSGEMLLLDPERRKLRVVALTNLPTDLIGFEFDFGEGLASQAILSRKPLHVPDYQAYEHRIREISEQFEFRSILSAPLLFRGSAIGALNVHFTSPNRRFRGSDLDLIAAFADHAAIAIDHARRYENEVRLARELTAANEELTRSLTVQMRLTEQVVLGRGLSGIAAELAALLGRSVVVQDRLWRPVAGAAPDGGDGWTSLVVPRPPTGRSGEESAPDTGDERVVVPVRVGSDVVGHLVLPAHEQLAALDRAVIEIAVSGVALEFAKLRAESEVEQRLQGQAIIDLIRGSFASADAMASRAARLGYDLDEPRRLYVLQVDPPPSDASEPERAELPARAADLVRDGVSRRAPGSMVVAHGESLVVLAVERDGGLPPEKVAAQLRFLVTRGAGDLGVSVAIGDICREAADYPTAYTTAVETLALMRKLDRRAAVVGSRELGSYRLLLKAASREELVGFADRTLRPILDHDRRTGGELVATLRAYLAEGGVQRRAAQRLVVHVNTVVYRLRRISELLDRDLGDPAAVFDLTLALQILDVTDGR